MKLDPLALLKLTKLGTNGRKTENTRKIAATHHADSLEPSITAWLLINPLKTLTSVNLALGDKPLLSFAFFNFFAIFNIPTCF